MDFCYRFPAVKGLQAGKEYYIAMIPLGILSKIFRNDEYARFHNILFWQIGFNFCGTEPLRFDHMHDYILNILERCEFMLDRNDGLIDRFL